MNTNEVNWTMTKEEVRAMKVKYELLDGDKEENRTKPPRTVKEWRDYFSFLDSVLTMWETRPQANRISEERLNERIIQQKELFEIGERWKNSLQP